MCAFSLSLLLLLLSFVAATLASGDVDLCLVPETNIVLDGPKGCLPHVMKRVRRIHVMNRLCLGLTNDIDDISSHDFVLKGHPC